MKPTTTGSRPPRSWLAAAWLAAAVVGSACVHDWDSLEASEEGAGGDSSAGGDTSGSGASGGGTSDGGSGMCPSSDKTVEGMCAIYCDRVNQCVVSDPGCVADCEADMGDCPPDTLDSVRSCLDAIDYCNCSGMCGPGSPFDIGFMVCLSSTVSCWEPPHSCP